VTSRKTPPWRAWRPLVAALALSPVFAAGALHAQQAGQLPFGLRGDTADAAAPDATPTSSIDDDTNAPNKNEAKAKKPKLANPVLDNKDQSQKANRVKPRTDNLPNLAPKAARLGLRGGPPLPDVSLIPSPTTAALPTPPPKPKPKPDENPFDPSGVSLGDLRLKPYVEEDIGYSTNPNFISGPTHGSFFETTDVGLGLQSDWARNDLHASLHGGYTDYFTYHQADTPNAGGTVDGRLDATRDLSFDAEGRFQIATQLPGSVSLPTGVVLGSNQRPLWETFGATIGGTQKFGDLSVSLHGLADRTTYQDATLADGSIDDLASDDFTDWGLKGRIAYQISPIITPFVESEIDTRRYDDAVDSNGYARTSDGVLGRGGVTLALSNQLTGEISGGYGERHYQDARLPMLAAPLFNASLVWSATALTKVTLGATTSLSDTTLAAASGAVSRTYSIDVSHALRRYLTIDASASVEKDDFVGITQNDTITTLALKVDYNITRDIMLRGSVSRQQYTSNVPNSNYTADIFMLGLKLQR
jgi:hypothetical protein